MKSWNKSIRNMCVMLSDRVECDDFSNLKVTYGEMKRGKLDVNRIICEKSIEKNVHYIYELVDSVCP